MPYDVEAGSLEELSQAEAELLLALPDDAARLKWFRRRDRLRAASELTVGTAVDVEKAGEWLRGIVRYIGTLTEPTCTRPLSGRYFGVELQVRRSRRSEPGKSPDGTCLTVIGAFKTLLSSGNRTKMGRRAIQTADMGTNVSSAVRKRAGFLCLFPAWGR